MKRTAMKLIQISAISHERLKSEAFRLGIGVHDAAEIAITEGIHALESATRVALTLETVPEVKGTQKEGG